MSILDHNYYIIIDSGISEPWYGWYVADGLNATYKQFISMLIENV